MSQSDPVAEKKPLSRSLYFLTMLGMTTFAFLLIMWGGANVFEVVSVSESRLRGDIFNLGLLSYLYGVWVATTGIALFLIVLDTHRAKPLPMKLRIAVGIALFTAMTITTAGYYGGTVERSQWRLSEPQIFTRAKPGDIGCDYQP